LFRYNLKTKNIKKVFTVDEDFESFYLEDGELYMNVGGVQKILQNY